jgi:uncharacterized protein
MDRIVTLALDILTREHACHTVILYGSRHRGDFRADSDYDVLGFRVGGEKRSDARIIDGKYLDAFIYPDDEPEKDLEQFLRLRGAGVLIEKNGFGTKLIEQVQSLYRAGPKPVAPDQLQLERLWILKTLARARSGDIEANYRRVSLLQALLSHYFMFRKMWFLGSKESFLWLAENDPQVRGLFETALNPGASLEEISELALAVLKDN